ncbi:hypothetical protein [Streptomyces sp. NPDC008139]|uniref:hypothetical protein n=1 Tax=Streptomyces sp. NPDC008139 TaxID=3364814 RepID=UPI0036E540A1
MRTRTAAVALTTSLLAAATCLPDGSAAAATGRFSYTFMTRQGPLTSVLTDPPSGQCLVLPEVIGPRAYGAAYAPWNETGETVRVYTGADCTGGYATLRPHSRRAPEQVTLRAVWVG